jgi:flagellar export protein FliJ
MSELAALIKFAERRAEGALIAWQRLKTQYDDAKQKLAQLHRHGEGYRDLMRSALQQGVSATSAMAHIGFIGQIEAVALRQEHELGDLEAACARQWRELLEARREKRMYEILRERAATREAEAAFCRRQADIDELLQRAAKRP